MKCNHCQRNLPDDSEFCQYCGKRIEPVESESLDAKGIGLDEDNPVLAGGIDAQKEYISKLCTSDGKRITWTRVGSKYVDAVKAMVDIFTGKDDKGNKYGPIFINMYAKETTTVPVEGFSLESEITSTYDPSTSLIMESINAALTQASNSPSTDGTKTEKVPKTPKKRFCSHCGGEIDSKTKKCTKCGKSLFPLKTIIISALSLVVVAGIVILAIFFIIPEIKYNKGVSLANEGKYDEANKLFSEIIDYKDSRNLIHTHVFDEVVEEVAPSCETNGYIIKKCSCGETQKETVEKTGHNFTEVVEKKDATCESDGYVIKKCSCGENNKEIINKLGHSFTAATCTEPQKCTRCGKTGSKALGHEYDYAVCPRCGKVLFETKTFSGYGPAGIKDINLPEGEYYFTSNFSGPYLMTAYFENEMIVNKIGAASTVYKYTTPYGGVENGILDVAIGDGSWTITIEAIG